MMSTPRRCALYRRVSTESQAERYGLTSQLTDIPALAIRTGYAIVGDFADDGVSGTILERPQPAALRALVRGRAGDVVLAHTSDRLSRELGHLLLLLDEFRRAGVGIEYVSHTPEDSAEGAF